MTIATNMSALNTWNQLTKNTNAMNSALEKLSSGYKINSASDDAAGLAISEKMLNQINGLDQASNNAQDASSLVQTADGALEETNSILERMRELAVQSASDTNTSADRANIQDEVDALVSEINNIADTTQFNTKKLLDGSMSKAVATATVNIESNDALKNSGGTLATNTALTALTDTAGNSLGIATGDTVTVSYMKDGTLYSKSITLTTANVGSVTLNSLATGAGFKLSVVAAASSTAKGVATGTVQATASTTGTAGAIYGLTIKVTDKNDDNISAATDALSSFTQTTAAKDKTVTGTATVLIGANTGQDISINIGNMDATALGVEGIDVSSQAAANVAISVIDTATATVSAQRAELGAVVNRLDATTSNLSTASENLTAANSLIKDTDMASEMATYTKLSVITQAATAMLAQANSQPQSVLKLIQG
ncbi:MAG: flagellin [Negativicutes bacterium]|nr:flagellin [Negativicutes bacterium]